MPAPTDPGLLSGALSTMIATIQSGQANLVSPATSLLTKLVILETIVVAAFYALSPNQPKVGELLKKIIAIGLISTLVQNWSTILSAFITGAKGIGFFAAGATTSFEATAPIDFYADPTLLITKAHDIVGPALVYISSTGPFSFGVSTLLAGLAVLLCYLAFAIMAIQIFVLRIEFAIISSLAIILVPFSVFKPTAFIGEKVFGALISFGIKTMVLVFIGALIGPVLNQLAIGSEPSFAMVFNAAVIAFAMTILSLHAPGVAAGLISGAPALTAGAVASTAALTAGAVGGMVAAGKLGLAAAGSAPSAVRSTIEKAASIGAAGVGMAQGLANAGAALNGSGGASSSGQSGGAGAVSGALQGIKDFATGSSSAARNAISSGVSSVANSISSPLTTARDSASSAAFNLATGAGAGAGANSGSSTTKTSSTSAANSTAAQGSEKSGDNSDPANKDSSVGAAAKVADAGKNGSVSNSETSTDEKRAPGQESSGEEERSKNEANVKKASDVKPDEFKESPQRASPLSRIGNRPIRVDRISLNSEMPQSSLVAPIRAANE